MAGRSAVGKSRLYAALLLVVPFATLAVSIKPTTVFGADRAVMAFFVGHRVSSLTAGAMIFNFIGSIYGIGLMLLCLSAWLWRKDRQLAQTLVLGTIGLAVLVELIKVGVARPRPPAQLFDELNFSFPSSHSTLAVYFFGWLAIIANRYAPPAFKSAVAVALPVLVVLIGLSRIYVGAHWPSDVLAGFCLGLGALFFSAGRTGERPIAHDVRGLPNLTEENPSMANKENGR